MLIGRLGHRRRIHPQRTKTHRSLRMICIAYTAQKTYDLVLHFGHYPIGSVMPVELFRVLFSRLAVSGLETFFFGGNFRFYRTI